MVQVILTIPDDLTTFAWQAWERWQSTQAELQSPYFTPEFTQAVSLVRDDVEIAQLFEAGELVGVLPFQRGAFNLGKPVGGKLSDYHGVIGAPGLALDPGQIVRDCFLGAWDFEHVPKSQVSFVPHAKCEGESPQLWLHEGFEHYCRDRKASGSDVVAKTWQKARKLERERGAVTLTVHDPSAEIFDLLVEWKRAQFARTGIGDVLASDWTIQLLKNLLASDSTALRGVMTVLRVDEKPVAICYSLRSRGVLHGWFTAYDRDFGAYSPGLILFLKLAEVAEREGITLIDLGKGDERYKQSLASSSCSMMEGSVTTNCLGVWLRARWRSTRTWLDQSAMKSMGGLPEKIVAPLRKWILND